MMENNLQALVEQAMHGDADALAQLCDEKMRVILYTSLKYARNMSDAEDIAQEVLIRIYKGIGSLKSPRAFNVWVHKIIKNEYIMFQKKAQKAKGDITMSDVEEMLSETSSSAIPHAHFEDEEKRQQLLTLIDTLPDNYKHTLIMFFYEGMSYKEIAQVLSIPTKTVANNLMRAKKALLKKLAVSEEEENSAGAMWFGGIMAAALSKDMVLKISDAQIQNVLSRATLAAQQTGNTPSPKQSPAKVASYVAAGVVGVGVLIGGILYVTNNGAGRPTNNPVATQEQSEKPFSSAGAEQSLPQHDAPSAEGVDIYSPSPEQSGAASAAPSVKPSTSPSVKPKPSPSKSVAPSASVTPSQEVQKAGLKVVLQVDPQWANAALKTVGSAEVRLYPKGQTSGLLAKAAIGKDFVADFGQIPVDTGAYDIYIKLDNNGGYTFEDGTHVKWQGVNLQQGSTTSSTVYIKPVAICTIVFNNGEGGGSSINPQMARVQGDVLAGASVEWIVVYNGQTVATATGDEINEVLRTLGQTGEKGTYSIAAKTQNIYNQNIRISTTFTIS